MEKTIKDSIHSTVYYEVKNLQSESYLSKVFLGIYIFVNLVPPAILILSDLYSPVTQVSLILFLLGAFLVVFSMSKNIGRTQLLLSPLFLLYIIPPRPMLLALGEGMQTIDIFYDTWISGLYACMLYIPVIIISIYQVRKKIYMPTNFKKLIAKIGIILIIASYIIIFNG